jgi:Na+-transporting NADH:ubiquinone oxidoreductase subunit B
MLRKLLDYQLSWFEKGKKLHRFRPAVSALDSFFYEAPTRTTTSPHVRDAVDLKRWMILVVLALLPCTIMAIWNTGVQKLVYTSGDVSVMEAFLKASTSAGGYFDFCFSDGRWATILGYGLAAFLPVVILSYAVGGIWEMIFAVVRGHEIAEGFLVTGILFPLSLPPTIPYWMVIVGVSFGVIVGKELFGGTGMNILNPALTCRIFLFFTFPAAMTGAVWVGTNPTAVTDSLRTINEQAETHSYDAYTQASPLAIFNIGNDVKRVHVDAIATNNIGSSVPTYAVVQSRFKVWNEANESQAKLGSLTGEQLKAFVTDPTDKGGLGLSGDSYAAAYQFTGLEYGLGKVSNGNLFWGNRLGSMGETSIFAVILGALFMLWVGVASWRTMVAMVLGAYITALIFQFSASTFGAEGGAWNVARLAFPAYKQLIMGSLAFGLVFMATEPVSSPTLNGAKWVYGAMAGVLTIAIRYINPAYPEAVMLAILFCNVFAPLFDAVGIRLYRKRRLRFATAK